MDAMREMTATEVSRDFDSVLDRAERGETIVVTRGGKRLAVLAPAPVGNGAAIRNFLASRTVEEGFAEDVASARQSTTDELSAAWHDG